MRTIGLIGGMSWESSAVYYRILNQTVSARLGGMHSARCLMLSLDFAAIAQLQAAGDWGALEEMMIAAARDLERGGAELLLICTNTMHRMAEEVAGSVAIPLLHIVDPTAQALRAAGHARVGLLGTAFTMEQPFYRERLEAFGLEVLVPEAEDRATVHDIIYRELVRGQMREPSRSAYAAVMARLADRGAEAIILGCTEIMLLVRSEDSPVPLFDTTRIHAEAALELALA